MRILLSILTLYIVFHSCSLRKQAGYEIFDLRCENLKDPIAIDISNPLLSWKMRSDKRGQRQLAYRVIVASSKEKLEKELGDYWDTGKIKSGKSVNIRYDGKTLRSRDILYWKVKVWNAESEEPVWSKTAKWEMSFLKATDWKAKWIGISEDKDPVSQKTNPAPYFRKEIRVQKEIRSAKAYVSGLGYYEMYLNGTKTGDEVLAPAQTNYDKRDLPKLLYHYDDQSTTRVFYNTFDVTGQLRNGDNCIGIVLGNGWYNQRDRVVEGILWYSTPRFILQLEIEYSDGEKETIISDEKWKVTTGPLLHDGIFTGEVYDARLEIPGWNQFGFDVSKWMDAEVVRAPTGQLESQLAPPDKIIRSFKPRTISKLRDGKILVDAGEMISGWIRLQINEKEGQKVSMRFIEELGSSYGQKDVYIASGNGTETYEPRFTWHAFRTIEIDGLTQDLTNDDIDIVTVNTDVKQVGSFQCSNELFNKIQDNYIRTQLGNFHGSISSDCPHRERLGYTGDGSILVESSIYNFDMTNFYQKWVNDMDDARNKNTGFVPHTAPFGGGGGGPAWGSAYIITPWYYYVYYGESRILEQHYSGMKLWVEYLGTRTDERGIVVREEPRGWCLGDWATPVKIEIPPAYVNTCYYFHCSDLMAKVASVLNKQEDADYYSELANNIRNNINSYFFNAETNQYWEGWQGANVFALAFGIVPEEHIESVLKNLIANIHKNKGHLDTGILATPLLLDVLTKYGREDLVFSIMDQRDFPGFGDYILGKGATTLWENWNGASSHSHPMYGSVIRWFYQALAGIYPGDDNNGFKEFVIKPALAGDLTYASADYNSNYGKISSHWKLVNNDLVLNLEIPANTTATVHIPFSNAENIYESNKLVDENGEIKFLRTKDQGVVYKVGSGKYSFTSLNVASKRKPIRVSTPEISPKDTLFQKPGTALITIKSATPDARIYYSTNGLVPTNKSELYKGPVSISGNSEIKAIALKEGYDPSYVKAEEIQFIDPDINGLKYTVYEGAWTDRPEIGKLKAVSSGKQFDFNVNRIEKREDYVAIVFTGFIRIETSGLYTFYSAANDGSWFYVNNKLIVNNTGDNYSGKQSGRILLNKGIYPVKVVYYENSGTETLNVAFKREGGERQPIPPSMLFLSEK